jgi:hypothetical protein
MLFVAHDPGKELRLLADFQIQRFCFRLVIKAQPKAKATVDSAFYFFRGKRGRKGCV